MGQTASTIVAYFIILYVKLLEKIKSTFGKDKKEKTGYWTNNDILLKEDEHKAGKIISN